MPETVIAPFTTDEWIGWVKWIKDTHGVTNEEIQVFLGIKRATDWKHSLDEATARILEQKEARDEAFKQIVGEDDPPLDPGNVPLDPEPQPEPAPPANRQGSAGKVSTEISIGGYAIIIEAGDGDTPAHILSRLDVLSAALKLIKAKHQDMKPYQEAAQQEAPKKSEEPPTKSREYYAFKRFVDGDEKTITLPYYHELSGKEAQHPDIVSKQGHRLFDKAMEEAGLKLADYEHGKTVKMKIVGTWKQGKLMEKKKPEDPDQYYRTWIGFTITP